MNNIRRGALFAGVLVTSFFRLSAAGEGKTETSLGWLERETLTQDWAGARPWLKEYGLTVKPRLTHFYQAQTSGSGEQGFENGGKADLWVNADLSKVNVWTGLSLTVHGEYNYGQSVNGRGGTLIPVNTALQFPGIDGAEAFDLSSVYVSQSFANSSSLVLGKINMMDAAATKPFMGGAGIDSFWNCSFVAPPSGTVPPYLFGAMMTVPTPSAVYSLWVYDPTNKANQSVFDNPFEEGMTVRGGVEWPVTLGGRLGHQGLVASYSTQDGTDLESLGDALYPPLGSVPPGIKDSRYYGAYTFDQSLYQSSQNPKEGVGLFGQLGVSDGNPNKLDWGVLTGLGGVGLIPGRSNDNWGLGFYHYSVSDYFKDALAPTQTIRDEEGWELFYNLALTPWLQLGADLQIIRPAIGANKTAVFPGLRTVVEF